MNTTVTGTAACPNKKMRQVWGVFIGYTRGVWRPVGDHSPSTIVPWNTETYSYNLRYRETPLTDDQNIFIPALFHTEGAAVAYAEYLISLPWIEIGQVYSVHPIVVSTGVDETNTIPQPEWFGNEATVAVPQPAPLSFDSIPPSGPPPSPFTSTRRNDAHLSIWMDETVEEHDGHHEY